MDPQEYKAHRPPPVGRLVTSIINKHKEHTDQRSPGLFTHGLRGRKSARNRIYLLPRAVNNVIVLFPSSMTLKRATPLQRSHAVKYAVKLTQKCTENSSEVLSCECLFCLHFGREYKVRSKRQKTANIKYVTKPFGAGNYRKDHEKQQPDRWKKYRDLSEDDRETFFDQVSPVKQTSHAYFGPEQVCQRSFINASIVNVINRDTLRDPEKIDGETNERMTRPFEDCADETEDLEEGEGVDR